MQINLFTLILQYLSFNAEETGNHSEKGHADAMDYLIDIR